jgi:glyoxylase-like metal-dependent hydrolase (beta-lactamase superfamily II)
MQIHTLHSRIANLYLVQHGGASLLVDTGFAGAAPRVLRALAQLGLTPRDVRLIFLTHAHMDHIGSAAELRRRTGAPIAMHRADVPLARAGKHNLPNGRGTLGRGLQHAFNGMRFQFRYEPFTPDLLIADGESLREFGWDARVIETPGHSLGSVTLAFGDTFFIGDAIINQLRVGMPLYGEDLRLAYDSARKLEGLRPRILYSGHGKPFSGAELARYFELKHRAATRRARA